MLRKRLTKIGDSTGIVIDRPILDMLGLDKGDEVSLRIDKGKLIIERADESVTRGKRREKLEKARTRMHGDIGGAAPEAPRGARDPGFLISPRTPRTPPNQTSPYGGAAAFP